MIFIFFLLCQDIDFENLYDTASTSLVMFQAEKDSAFSRLVELGKDTLLADTTIAFLVSKFDTKSAVERHTLKNILKKIGKSAIKGIVKRIDVRGSDEESRSLSQSLWVLGEIGSEDVVEPASHFIADHQWRIRSKAYTTLGKSESEKALPYIIRGLNDTVSVVRKSAYYALGNIATQMEIPLLIKGLDDEFYGVRYAASKGLTEIGEEVISPLLELIGEDRQRDFFIFKVVSQLKFEDKEGKILMEHIEEKDPTIRLLIYEEIDDIGILKTFLGSEKNEFLKNYILKKLSGEAVEDSN
jgi:HEAT repeat protein